MAFNFSNSSIGSLVSGWAAPTESCGRRRPATVAAARRSKNPGAKKKPRRNTESSPPPPSTSQPPDSNDDAEGDVLDNALSRAGLEAPRPGQALDDMYTGPKSTTFRGAVGPTSEPGSGYRTLITFLGRKNVAFVEKTMTVALTVLLGVLISTGVTIGVEAYFKAVGQGVPQELDNVVVKLEALFTPTMVVFLIISVTYGLLKQSQLESGDAGYSEGT